jgi:hypothetical protein
MRKHATATGAAALVLALIFAGLCILGWYALNHNAFDNCFNTASPPGALPYEPGYAGSDVMTFPVTGLQCSWNGTDGGVFTTFEPNIPVTAMIWLAPLLALAGVAALIYANVRRRRTDG